MSAGGVTSISLCRHSDEVELHRSNLTCQGYSTASDRRHGGFGRPMLLLGSLVGVGAFLPAAVTLNSCNSITFRYFRFTQFQQAVLGAECKVDYRATFAATLNIFSCHRGSHRGRKPPHHHAARNGNRCAQILLLRATARGRPRCANTGGCEPAQDEREGSHTKFGASQWSKRYVDFLLAL